MEVTSAKRVCILVLGMHRSGTSALAGVLHQLGCGLPASLMQASEANAKGFFESTAVRDFNDELLASAATRWDDFRDVPSEWGKSPIADGFKARAIKLLEAEFEGQPLVVLKDPRICRLVPFWREAIEQLGYQFCPILTIRNPVEVTTSLFKKKGFSEPRSQMLWLRHVLDAEAATRGLPRHHTSYDTVLLRWPSMVAAAQKNLALVFPRQPSQVEFEVQEFLSADLRHSRIAPEDTLDNPLLAGWLRDCYRILDRWSRHGENPEDHPELDQIREEFDVASGVFGRLVTASEKQHSKQIATLRAQSEKTVADLTTSQAELETTKAERQTLQDSIGQISSLLDEKGQELDKALWELGERRAEMDQLRVTLASERDVREETDRELETTKAERQTLQDSIGQISSLLAQRSHEAEETAGELAKERVASAELSTALSKERKDRADAMRELDAVRARVESAEGGLGRRDGELAKLARMAMEHEAATAAALRDLASHKVEAAHMISQMKTQSQDLQSQLANITERLTLREQELAVTSRLSAEHEAARATIQQERDQMKAALTEEVRQLRSSTSWKMTAPLRAVVDWLRNNRRR